MGRFQIARPGPGPADNRACRPEGEGPPTAASVAAAIRGPSHARSDSSGNTSDRRDRSGNSKSTTTTSSTRDSTRRRRRSRHLCRVPSAVRHTSARPPGTPGRGAGRRRRRMAWMSSIGGRRRCRSRRGRRCLSRGRAARRDGPTGIGSASARGWRGRRRGSGRGPGMPGRRRQQSHSNNRQWCRGTARYISSRTRRHRWHRGCRSRPRQQMWRHRGTQSPCTR